MPTENLLALQLRANTRHGHRLLDHHPLLAALVHGNVNLESYAQALASLYATHYALEKFILEHAKAAGWSEVYMPRSPSLAADLAQLGQTPYPLQVPFPELTIDLPTVVGVLYVLEGSRLGGQFLSQQLRLQLPAQTPFRFFADTSGKLHPRWARFLALAHERIQPEKIPACCTAAQAGFFFIFEHLQSCVGEISAQLSVA